MDAKELQSVVGKLSKHAKEAVDKRKTKADGAVDGETRGVVEKIVKDLLSTNSDFVSQSRRAEHSEVSTSIDGGFFKSKAWRDAGGSVEKMLSMDTPVSGGQKDPVIQSIKEKSDDVFLMGHMKAIADDVPYSVAVKSLNTYAELQADLNDFTKALSTGETQGGAEFVPTNFSSELIDEYRLQLRVAALHRTIRMPSNPYNLPVKVGRSTAYIATQASGDDPGELRKSQLSTDNVSLDAVVLAVATPFAFEFEEDSVVPVMPMVRADVAQGIADAVEGAIINGDTGTTFQDTGYTVPAYDYRKSWDGYRKLCNSGGKVDFDTGTESFTTTNFRNIRKKMGRYGLRPSDLAWVLSIEAYIRMLTLSEVATVDKYGANATILRGELARFDNIPVIVSEHVGANLNTEGIYDGTTETETIALCVNRPSFVLGERRSMTVEAVRKPLTQQHIVVSTYRVDFQKVRPDADNVVGLGYNITA